ncbi:2'-phosphotransferase [Malassezia sp. CBS 17886]|nr:2'-phosphotransferase [Malassezia sp. CBS 17886]
MALGDECAAGGAVNALEADADTRSREQAKQWKKERKLLAQKKAAAAADADGARGALSKALAYILRHGAAKEHLPVRADGYVLVDAVLARPKVAKVPMPAPGGTRAPVEADICAVASTNDKKRFEVRRGGGDAPDAPGDTAWVRAVQGHSLAQVTDLAHDALTPDNVRTHLTVFDAHGAAYAIHGTNAAAWDKIHASGALQRMTRNHIHLATGFPGESGVISGAWVMAGS